MNIPFNGMKAVATRVAGKSGLVLKQHSPTILTVAGVSGMIAASVIAVKQTYDHLDEALQDFESNKSTVKDVYEAGRIDDQKFKKAMVGAHLRHATNLAKIYGPAITLGAVSIVSICAAHNILHKRNIALAAAYKGLEQSYSEYRKRVIEHIGEEDERNLYMGVREEEQTDPETGKKIKVTTVNPANGYSGYAKVFDQHNKNWVPNAEYNRIFLRNAEQQCNDMLIARGHLFLNDVYDTLGIERTKAGSVVGWVIGRRGQKDGFVDFGLWDVTNEGARRFMNGEENAVWLDFNVDGVVYNLLDD